MGGGWRSRKRRSSEDGRGDAKGVCLLSGVYRRRKEGRVGYVGAWRFGRRWVQGRRV